MTNPEDIAGQAAVVTAGRVRSVWGVSDRRLPFMPYGLAPLVGLIVLMLLALIPVAFGEIEAKTDAAAKAALKDAGADWATAHVSGQWVVLEGKPPSREAAEQALEAVRKAKAPTIFGEAQPATWVYDRFTRTEDPLLPGSGDRPQIGGEDTPAVAPPPGTQAEIASCDDTMARILDGSTIQFSTASTIVGSASGNTLDSIARAASSCPGVLRIEGHTDNMGRPGYNSVLSRERAEAVRDALIARGVPADRLVAQGFGSNRPIADNRTDEGRARNRRIEIHPTAQSPT